MVGNGQIAPKWRNLLGEDVTRRDWIESNYRRFLEYLQKPFHREILEQLLRANIGKQHLDLLCADTSCILGKLAPVRAALDKNPARNECLPPAVGSLPRTVPDRTMRRMLSGLGA
jgi:hypothetical protein